jgi:hypothetical protein
MRPDPSFPDMHVFEKGGNDNPYSPYAHAAAALRTKPL